MSASDFNAPWDLLRTFLAVQRAGTLSGAARTLGITQPTVGRQIDELEAAVGVPLFIRAATGMKPTGAAATMTAYAEAMERDLGSLARSMSTIRNGRSKVQITGGQMMCGTILPPLIATILDGGPNLSIGLTVKERGDDPERVDSDITVRLIKPTAKDFEVTLLGRLCYEFWAHRNYVEKHGLPQTSAECGKHRFVGFDLYEIDLFYLKQFGIDVAKDNLVLRCDSEFAHSACIRAGMGIGVMVRSGVSDPDLIPVLPDLLRIPFEVWLGIHRDLAKPGPARLVHDRLAELLPVVLKSLYPEENGPTPHTPLMERPRFRTM